MATEKIVAVNEGATYENNDTKQRVVAFHVDRPRSTVLFAPIGSGREDRTDIETFLKNYTLIAQEGEPLPEDKKANAEAQEQAAADRDATLKDMRTNDPTRTNTTRADLDARAAARNK